MARNPYKDQIAVVGVGSTPYGRDLGRSHLSLGLEARPPFPQAARATSATKGNQEGRRVMEWRA